MRFCVDVCVCVFLLCNLNQNKKHCNLFRGGSNKWDLFRHHNKIAASDEIRIWSAIDNLDWTFITKIDCKKLIFDGIFSRWNRLSFVLERRRRRRWKKIRIKANKFWMYYFILSRWRNLIACNYGGTRTAAKANLNKHCYGAKYDGRSPTQIRILEYTHTYEIINSHALSGKYLKMAFAWKLHGVVFVVWFIFFFFVRLLKWFWL